MFFTSKHVENCICLFCLSIFLFCLDTKKLQFCYFWVVTLYLYVHSGFPFFVGPPLCSFVPPIWITFGFYYSALCVTIGEKVSIDVTSVFTSLQCRIDVIDNAAVFLERLSNFLFLNLLLKPNLSYLIQIGVIWTKSNFTVHL